MTDRAVSQSLGFVLVFSVVVLSVGTVTVFGYGQLAEIRESEQLRNAERSLQLVGGNIGEIQDGRTVARTGALDLDRGRISLLPDAESRMRIRVADTSGPAAAYDETLVVGGIRYRYEDTTIGYEGGVVFRSDRAGNAVAKSTPPFVCTDDHAVVPVVTVEGEGNRSLGSGTVTVSVARNTSTIAFPHNRSGVDSTDGRANVSIEVVDSPFDSGWDRYFGDHDHWHQDGDAYVCAGAGGNGVRSYQVVRTRVVVTFVR